jgi:hypothetical protein
MNKRQLLATVLTVATVLGTASAFAETRHRGETNLVRAVTVEGRIRDIDWNRNQMVIRLDRSGYVLVASPRTDVYSRARRNTSLRDLERGDSIRATGRVESRGTMYVDSITLVREEDDRRDRDDRTLRGVVTSVDASRRIVWLREDRSGRTIEVDLRNAERDDRSWSNDVDRDARRRWNDLSRVSRGDRMTVSGDWRSNGRFEGERYNVTQYDRR